MDFNPVIFDISSDEEPAFDEPPRSGDDDHEWLTELLQTVTKETTPTNIAADDSDDDDVVVISEYVPVKPKSKSKSKPDRVVKDLDDDDCVVLDCDPDKAVNVGGDDGGGDDGDDVLFVGQTGQIACRDYPHPRHHCAKFAFSSTPHEQHCDLCHCYVCDSLAPCALWGDGTSTMNHCHATDKQEVWKIQRQESFRLKKTAASPVLRFPEAHSPLAAHPINQLAALDKQLAPNGRRNEVYRPVTNTFSSPRLHDPNIITHTRNRRHPYAPGRNGLTPCSVSQQPLGIRGHATLQNRDNQPVPYNNMFKRSGPVRSAFAKNQSVHGSSNPNFPRASPYVRNTVPVLETNIGNSAGWHGALPDMISGSYMNTSLTQPGTGSVSAPSTRSNNDQNINHLGSQSQNVMDSPFSDFDFGWMNNLGQSNQQTLVDNIQPQAIASHNEPIPDNQFTSQLTGSTEHDKDPEYASWLLSQSEGLASEADMDVFSPVPSAAFDADDS
ncbi:RPM1 interacting protein 13 [Euphorbia peplus]|nr:RPM1 interacting protein 13 [Euphorbia peplus]